MREPAAPNTAYSRRIMSKNHGRRTDDHFDEKIVIVRGALNSVAVYDKQ
jgi:hypothetical protein